MAAAYRVKKWLNKPGFHSTAFIFGSIEGKNGTLKISDCDRTITLDFDWWDRGGANNAIAKAKLLEEEMHKFRLALEKEVRSKYPVARRRPATRRRS